MFLGERGWGVAVPKDGASQTTKPGAGFGFPLQWSCFTGIAGGWLPFSCRTHYFYISLGLCMSLLGGAIRHPRVAEGCRDLYILMASESLFCS